MTSEAITGKGYGTVALRVTSSHFSATVLSQIQFIDREFDIPRWQQLLAHTVLQVPQTPFNDRVSSFLYGHRDKYPSLVVGASESVHRQQDGHSCLAHRDRYHGVCRSRQWRYLSLSSSTVWRTPLRFNSDRYHAWLQPSPSGRNGACCLFCCCALPERAHRQPPPVPVRIRCVATLWFAMLRTIKAQCKRESCLL